MPAKPRARRFGNGRTITLASALKRNGVAFAPVLIAELLAGPQICADTLSVQTSLPLRDTSRCATATDPPTPKASQFVRSTLLSRPSLAPTSVQRRAVPAV